MTETHATPRIRALSALAAGALLGLPATAVGQSTGNVCEDAIRSYIERNYGQTVARVEFRYQTNLQTGGGQMMLSQAVAFPNECPGYHFFDVVGDDFRCERQSGRDGSSLIIYRSSGDGC